MTIKTEIVSRLIPKYRNGLTWQHLVAAVQDTTTAEKAKMLQAIQRDQPAVVGKLLGAAVTRYIQTLAAQEADDMLANGSLDLTELDRILK